ncbi:MAG: Flp family type IVb pilin [Burkholderiaceae bacterium]
MYTKGGKQRQRGVTAIEYGLIVALIAIAIIGTLSAAGSENGGIWSTWTAAFIAAVSNAL